MYPDIFRCLAQKGHQVAVVGISERRERRETTLSVTPLGKLLKVRTGNITKTNLIEKGISTLLIEKQLISAIKRHFSDVKFDLVVYTTPPITFVRVVKYLKKRDGARSYLMLKDIFPQNAVDLGMMRKSGVKGLLYRYFRHREKELYAISDRIGCMSRANVDFVVRNNPELDPGKVEICPNCIEPLDLSLTEEERIKMRKKYGIPADKTVFVYGGNLGRPQGIPHIIDCMKSQKNNEKAYFLIVGDGTEYEKLDAFFKEEKPVNMKLMKRLPKEDYDRMIAACDVGLIFLDHRFTIPNFPSRVLSYMQAELPVLACTDPNSDIGQMVVEGGFGAWCESNDVAQFSKCVDLFLTTPLEEMKGNSLRVLRECYTVETAVNTVLNGIV